MKTGRHSIMLELSRLELGTEGNPGSGLEQLAPGVRALRRAVGADPILGPAQIARRVGRLHRGDDPELREAADVRRREHLSMLDPVPRAPPPRRPRGLL